MSRQARRDTRPELKVRRALHAAGHRYRVQYPVPGRPRRSIDIAFTRRRLAVFIDGCFWHRCPEHATFPASNSEWWGAKLDANAARDHDTNRVLGEKGWTVLRVWEHEPIDTVVAVIERTLKDRI